MKALERAHDLIRKANECEDSEGYALTVAEAHAMAAIAQAEAAHPRYVRLGDHTINLAHIAYVDWHKLDREGNRCIEITFSACSNQYALGLVFRGEECDPVDATLRGVLDPYTVATLEFPDEPDAAPDGYPFTVVE